MITSENIKANVIDIRSDNPQKTDRFLVDSNVWFWIAYSKASLNCKNYQSTYYPQYLCEAIATEANTHYFSLNVAELAHTIEKSERELFKKSNGVEIEVKDFRHIELERKKVISEVRNAHYILNQAGVELPVDIPVGKDHDLINDIAEYLLDGYDALILEAMKAKGVYSILTDDSDYACVEDITVFTANRNVITAAKGAGKLIVR